MFKKLDRVEGTNALIEGFILIFGEKHRELLKTKGDELIELGIKNGTKWANNKALKEMRVYHIFDMYKEGIYSDDKLSEIVENLELFLTNDEIEYAKNNDNIKGGSYDYLNGVEKYVSIFDKEVKESDTNIIQATAFDYFKEFHLHDKYNITLFGEGGLGLDSYNKKNLSYYQSEGELFYMIEDIARKFHYFGMLLAKDVVTGKWIDSIKKNLTSDVHYNVSCNLSNVIDSLIENEVEVESIILDTQKINGVNSGFITRKQLHEKVKLIDVDKLPPHKGFFKQ